MTFKERLDWEKDNRTKIILFNDRGLFYNLLEKSAYAFCTRIKPFKVNIKTLKGLDRPFVSIGVPVEKKDVYLSNLATTVDTQGNIIAELQEPIDENAFRTWKNHILQEYRNTQTIKNILPDDNKQEIEDDKEKEKSLICQYFQEIKYLNIASMTPMETMLYLNSLQQKLKDLKW